MIKKLLSMLVDRTPREIFYKLTAKKQIDFGNDLSILKENEHCFIFVLSTGRVGTQTLSALLNNTSLYVYHEPKPLMYGLSKLAYLHGDDEIVSEVLKEAFFASRKDLLGKSILSQKGYIETSPQNTFLAPVLLKLFGNIRFIYLYRDPRDVVISGMKRRWYDGHPSDSTRIVPKDGTDYAQLWSKLTPFTKNLWLWNETNQWIINFLKNVSEDKKIFVKSELLFESDRYVINSLFDFTDIPIPGEKYINKILRKKMNAQKRGNFPNYSDWSSDMKSEFESIVGDTARLLGYEF